MLELDNVMLSRLLTAITLIFHIIFATVGVGVPLMISIAEFVGIKRKDSHYILLAKRWARGFVVTVAVGVVTGTCIGLQLSLLWPSFMEVAGQIISLPLFMETFAFFFEAIFLGIYLYTWERFKKPLTHWFLSIPVVIGSSASAVFITTVNAFMNAPEGFEIVKGKIIDIDPLAAMFNPATPTKVAHVLSSAYLTSAFVLAAITAFLILKGKRHGYYLKALKLTMVSGLIFAVATAFIGDLSGKYLAEYQPEKLAAAEWHFVTEKSAPLFVGGILDEDQEVKYAIRLPFLLSILAHNDPNAEVTGLDQFPKDEIAPLWIHYLFDGMVGIGMYLALIAFLFVVFLWVYKRDKFPLWNPYSPWLLRAIVLGGPLSMLAIELGWVFTEVGRQPWILWHIMKTAEGATTSEHLDIMLLLFIALYSFLGIFCSRVLIRMFKDNPAEKEFDYHLNN